MKKKYVTIELDLWEFQKDEVILGSPASGFGSSTFDDDFENDLI